MIKLESLKSSKFDLFIDKRIDNIFNVLGGKEVMSKDTHQGASAPHAKDIADRTPSEGKWDNKEWITHQKIQNGEIILSI